MASKINADEFVDREGEGKPTLPKGVVLSGVTTITTATVADNEIANSTGINAGIITSTHFKGNLTGDVNAGIVTVTSQTVVGSAVTISASGIDIGAGVITATSYAGNGANLTGIGATIMTWEYNPDPYDTAVTFDTGIGITFNQKIKAGSGNITLREDSASGTVVENFGIGSSVTIVGNALSLTPTSDLGENKIYHLSYPSGVITNMAGENYVGTAYTFQSKVVDRELWMWGKNEHGQLGLNTRDNGEGRSSPVQLPGTTWSKVSNANYFTHAIKTDGTLWSWGYNEYGGLGQNQPNQTRTSSPVQLGSDTTWSKVHVGNSGGHAIKTDGTFWAWGFSYHGQSGTLDRVYYSSPTQIGSGTDWDNCFRYGDHNAAAVKTDGTLWMMGRNAWGLLGLNAPQSSGKSSPTQLPGTTWKEVSGQSHTIAVKTDGTLWTWGRNNQGQLGHNNKIEYSSPTQIPGSTWKQVKGFSYGNLATKTDGTLWAWGYNPDGNLGQNQANAQLGATSSPVQIPGSTWSAIGTGIYHALATKTDGTLWGWGDNNNGNLGQNQASMKYSSPVQIPGTTWIYGQSAIDRWRTGAQAGIDNSFCIKEIT